jgi:hypothetical protein
MTRLRLALAFTLALLAAPAPAAPPRPGERATYTTRELVDSGHSFFGNVSRGLALTMEEAVRRWGEPEAYILGQEGSGAFFGGLTYGEGTIYTRAGNGRKGAGERIYWQGPSLGFDVGGNGSRAMMLVFNVRAVPEMYRRFLEVEGSAYIVAGFGLNAARAGDTVVVPIRAGVGLRLGVALGYLKFTDAPTWNPF